jgi:hypothetical protein
MRDLAAAPFHKGVVLAVAAHKVKVRAALGKTPAALPRDFVVAGDLLDQLDDPAAQFAVLDLHERLGQRQSIGRSQKVGDISR